MSITATDTITVEGTVSSDGQSTAVETAGAGSGGYGFLTAPKVMGTGKVSASGGSGLSTKAVRT